MRWQVLLLLLLACSPAPHVVAVSCADPLAGCQLQPGLTLRFSRPPATMQSFDLLVQTKGRQVYAAFQMRGMEMGLNRYRLVPDGDVWRASVMLPACVQGRRDWLLQLEVDGTTYEMPFTAGYPNSQ